MKIVRTDNGIVYWDVVYGETLIARFDRKWEAQAFIRDRLKDVVG